MSSTQSDEDTRYIAALRSVQETPESYVLAESVARRLADSPFVADARPVGQRLSRLAKRGLVERRWHEGYACWAYRPMTAGGD